MGTEKKEIKGIECKFAVYCPPPKGSFDRTDLHFVKEVIHYTDGTTEPNTRLIKNFKREFYIEKKGSRNYTQKKEWREKSNLLRYETTQSEMGSNIARALNVPYGRPDMRALLRSPYVYGADIDSTALLKKKYMDKYPGVFSRYKVAVYDIETNVLDGSNEIMMATLSSGKDVLTVIRRSFFHGWSNVENRLNTAKEKYLGEVIKRRGIEWEFKFVDHEDEVVETIFNRAHKLRPDFVAIWNLDFDLPRSVNALVKVGKTPESVFCDPSVPDEFKFYRYKQGPSQKVTASGKVTPIKPAARWHTAYCPASFYLIDAMCGYKHIRTGQQEEQSYGLDSILKKNKLGGKLKFEEADGLEGLEWHQFMQEKYPFEYVIYNGWDCISMEEQDEKILDLQMTLPQMSQMSDYDKFKSQPRRVVDQLHFFVEDKGYSIGTTSDEMASDLDKYVPPLEGQIITLPAELIVDNGLCIFEDIPTLRSNLHCAVADLDVSASYPLGGSSFNISKETTHKELHKIEGVDYNTQQMCAINLSGGATNTLEICNGIFKLPTCEELLSAFERSQ